MNKNFYKVKEPRQAVANPANLRWQYAIESLLENNKSTDDDDLAQQLRICMDSLSKFPLVLEELTHCAILNGFNRHIINLLANIEHASPQISDEGQEEPIKTLKDWNLSPISTKKRTGMLHDAILNKTHISDKREENYYLSFVNFNIYR